MKHIKVSIINKKTGEIQEFSELAHSKGMVMKKYKLKFMFSKDKMIISSKIIRQPKPKQLTIFDVL